ncbi:MAG: hypothetical protein HC780_14815 [Leptolyngbyaceae cyanobacterium CSU_1_3]|nr:hypothetical protein [Leptolyngbyaceae cyanobacterium CSU_1_3]
MAKLSQEFQALANLFAHLEKQGQETLCAVVDSRGNDITLDCIELAQYVATEILSNPTSRPLLKAVKDCGIKIYKLGTGTPSQTGQH